MIGDEAVNKLTNCATWRSTVEWRDQAELWESRAEHSFDVEEIRYAAETARLLRAVSRWRQMYAEVTA